MAIHTPAANPGLFWPYLLWSAIFAVTAWTRYAPQDPVGYMKDQVKVTIAAMGPYWFIAVLPVFFVAARAGRSRPKLLLAAAVLVYLGAWPLRSLMMASEAVPTLAAEGVFRFTIYALWFIAGYVLREHIIVCADRAHRLVGLLGVGVFVTIVISTQDAGFGVFVDRMLLAAETSAGLLAAVVLVPWLARCDIIARVGKVLGSRTLAIYLIHPLVINVVVVWYPGSALGSALRGSVVADVLLVPAVTALAVAIAVGLRELVKRWGPEWLFAAPRVRERKLTTSHAHH
ncbi:MAG: acyltransferase [Brachybacterium sp.]|nr:acyltransferase [Brachybacterium sp.]MDN5901039.1 acyltransferase [Brachybacterium sp.]